MNKKNALKQLNKLVDISTLTPAEVRVEVAKDVIASLTLDKIIPNAGVYCGLEFEKPMSGSFNLREEMLSVKKCSVCAIGSAMYAFVARFNNYTSSMYGFYGDLSISDMIDTLSPYFSKEQLSLMELAFGGFTFMATNNSDEDVIKAKSFCPMGTDEYLNYKSRLIKIMQNIVDHDGLFQP